MSSSATPGRAARLANSRSCSSKGTAEDDGSAAEASPDLLSSKAAKAETRSVWPITALRLPVSGSKRNRFFASAGCTASMSMRKLKAPRLSARRSKVPACTARAGSTSVCANASTSSRMCSAAAEACDRPSTDNTPRIADSCAGTGISSWRCEGSRKYWSICFSISDSEARNSCTTLPMVWRSLTRRYSSSIHTSSGCGSAPWRTASMRADRCSTRGASSG